MKKKSEVLLAIKQFAKEIGAPASFVADMSGEQMSSEVKKICNDIGTTLRALEEGTPWSNKAELYIGLIKEAVRKDMCELNSPLCFWDYCVERRARINNLTAKNAFKLHGSTPQTLTTGDEGDISNLCQYRWYEWCYFRDQTAAFPNNKEVLGRVLGPARGAGNEMAQWILKANGRVVPRRSLRPLKVDEIHSPVEIKKREVFDELIKRRWGTPMTPSNTQQPKAFKKYEDQEQQEQPTLEVEDIVEAALNKSVKFDDQVNDEEKYIMSMVQAAVTKTLNQKSDQQSQGKPKVSLKSILKQAKNNNKNSQHLKLKTLLTLLASSSTNNQHMTKLSMLESRYNLEKKWSMAR